MTHFLQLSFEKSFHLIMNFCFPCHLNRLRIIMYKTKTIRIKAQLFSIQFKVLKDFLRENFLIRKSPQKILNINLNLLDHSY